MSNNIIRNYKDTVFRMIFKEKKELLELYNAINHTNYDNSKDLEIVTLENAIYMSMKNDVSCLPKPKCVVFYNGALSSPF